MMKIAAIKLIAAYQKFISPMLGQHCRFYPSCSEYCKESLSKFGLLKGLAKGLARLLRCHPFSQGGYDPLVK